MGGVFNLRQSLRPVCLLSTALRSLSCHAFPIQRPMLESCFPRRLRVATAGTRLASNRGSAMRRLPTPPPATSCTFRWMPYKADSRMGLNHQMSSLSCAMNEASHLGRTLILPSEICMDSGHNAGARTSQKVKSSQMFKAGQINAGGSCVPLESLFDIALLNSIVAARVYNSSETYSTIRSDCDSECARRTYPCAEHPHLQRKQTGFWFSPCLRGGVNVDTLARKVQVRLGRASGYSPETAPSLALLRSGLFYSRSIKSLARSVRRHIGGRYSALHLRRSDKIRPPFCRPAECRTRDLATQVRSPFTLHPSPFTLHPSPFTLALHPPPVTRHPHPHHAPSPSPSP